MPKIIKNACRCKKCGTYLESKHRHDFKGCGCPANVCVDGGKEYTRRLWNGELGSYNELIEDLSEYEEE
jgi:hypothetical protein